MIPFCIILLTVVTVYLVDRWENKYVRSIFDWFPAILLAYLIPAGLSLLLGQDYSDASIHEWNKTLFIPLAVIAAMSSLSMQQLRSIGWKPLIVFFAGSFWIAVFPVALSMLWLNEDFIAGLLIDQMYWKGLPPIVGSWIGGSTSQLVLKELVECPEHIFLTILVMDNILVNIWTIIMFQGIKKSKVLNKRLGITDLQMPEHIKSSTLKPLHPLVTLSFFCASILITNAVLESFIAKILLLSLIGILLSNYVKGWDFKFSLKIGSLLILIVMAVLGLKLKFDTFQFDLELLLFLIIWLTSHFFVMLLVAKLINVNTAWVPIASMANVGGIATAPAVTAAYEKKWMPHAIILAILSMATGTIWGMLTIYLFQLFFLNSN